MNAGHHDGQANDYDQNDYRDHAHHDDQAHDNHDQTRDDDYSCRCLCHQVRTVWRPGLDRADMLRRWEHVQGCWPVLLAVLVAMRAGEGSRPSRSMRGPGRGVCEHHKRSFGADRLPGQVGTTQDCMKVGGDSRHRALCGLGEQVRLCFGVSVLSMSLTSVVPPPN